MIIALDYDQTFTLDPQSWYEAMRVMKLTGHTVIGVTMRYPGEASGMDMRYDNICDRLYFTGRKAKKLFMASQGIHVDVWIDDNPEWVINDA